MNNVEKIKPNGLFTNYIYKAIPLAFDESMSYYETLCGLRSYLQDTVIPALNNNADAIIEVQNLMTELQNYVDNYFDNLDVQEEINNKLDEMVEDGTLENIINQEIFSDINTSIDILESNRTVVIGDSYLRGDHNGISAVNGWGHYFKTATNLSDADFFSFAEGGAGFVKTGDSGHTFKTLLQANINTITDKNTIKNVIICGGCNDREQNYNSLVTAISDMVYYCKQQFTNANVYVGMIGNNASISDETYRRNVILRSLNAYKQCIYYGAKYLTGVEYLMHNYSYYDDTDNTHPTQEGYRLIGKAIFNLLYNDVSLPFYQSTDLIGKQALEWNSDFVAGSNSTQMGFTSIINGTSKQVFINPGDLHITASNIHFTDNLLKLTNSLPFNLNYRNFYKNYTPGWSGIIYVKFEGETDGVIIPGYYMIRDNALYFNTFGINNRNITQIYIPGCNNNCDLLYS